MRPTTVFRVETAEGCGPYQRPSACKWTRTGGSGAFNGARHPTLYEDSGLRAARDRMDFFERDAWYFGFSDVPQLRSWFYRDEHLHDLDDDGFHLATYEVPPQSLLYGNAQAVFKRSEATLVSRVSLLTLLPPAP